MANHLSSQTSPYLLQHAHNPVDWYPWGEEALELARKLDRPILVSIGYSACHWCHVMEKESFEDETTAALMNAGFINIKVDREERPDVDHVYMDAVQAMTGQGGWPLNVFLTPDTRPFFGGTYFPPVRFGQRPSWKEVLESVATAYKEHKTDIDAQADNLIRHLQNANQAGAAKEENILGEPVRAVADRIRTNLLQQADTVWGGFGRAPKFPQTFSIQYLLRDYYLTGTEASVEQALLSLDKMLQGGIYDQIGGGFARYSTDDKWLAPHFEKMLYDNALLMGVLSEAFQLTGKTIYEQGIRETVAFLCREMQHPGGAFYAALDADSEGVEGKYYTWQKPEIEAVLGHEAELFCLVYDVETKGNWEDTNILWLPQQLQEIAAPLKIDPGQLAKVLKGSREKLLAAREKRVHPGLDDKILLSWNAMLITGLCKAYSALGDQELLSLAEQAYGFLEQHLSDGTGAWQHTWKGGQAKIHGFLDDYALIIQAAIALQEATGAARYLAQAALTAEYVIRHFDTAEKTFFYYTEAAQSIIVRKIELYDNATPSGNAVMAENLLQLAILLDRPEWRQRAYGMLQANGSTFSRYPTSFGIWCSVWQKMAYGIHEIAILGEHAAALSRELGKHYLPMRLLQFSEKENPSFPLLADKKVTQGKTMIYLCKDYSCRQPVETVTVLLEQITVGG